MAYLSVPFTKLKNKKLVEKSSSCSKCDLIPVSFKIFFFFFFYIILSTGAAPRMGPGRVRADPFG